MLSIEHLPKHAESILSTRPYRPAEPTLHVIMQITAEACEVPMNEFLSHRRAVKAGRARQIYYGLARELTTKSFPQIAYYCGNRDHSTAVYGARQVADRPKNFEPELSMVRSKILSRMCEPSKSIGIENLRGPA
jgi:chromosomal replication initiation ATPase DnaA